MNRTVMNVKKAEMINWNIIYRTYEPNELLSTSQLDIHFSHACHGTQKKHQTQCYFMFIHFVLDHCAVSVNAIFLSIQFMTICGTQIGFAAE
jgi:hypothetical protein